MKLKTLEDLYELKNALFSGKGEKPKGFAIDSEELRQEAIRWIKEYDKDIQKIQTNNFKLPYQPKPEEWIKIGQIASQRSWIKHFFNIKEEDLK